MNADEGEQTWLRREVKHRLRTSSRSQIRLGGAAANGAASTMRNGSDGSPGEYVEQHGVARNERRISDDKSCFLISNGRFITLEHFFRVFHTVGTQHPGQTPSDSLMRTCTHFHQ